MNPRTRQILIAIMIAANLFFLWDTLNLINSAKHAPGVVTQWVYHRSAGRGKGSYNVQFEFTLPNGETRSMTSSYGTGITSLLPSLGQKIDVLYVPDDAGQVRINGFYDLWFPSAMVAFVTVLLGVVLFFVKRGARAQNPDPNVTNVGDPTNY